MSSRFYLVVLTFGIFLYTSCNSSRLADSSTEVPDTISRNYHQVTISSTGRIEISADQLETYNSRDVMIFSKAVVEEFDNLGELTMEGSADRIEATGDRDGVADGSIRVYDVVEGSHLIGEHLEWKDSERMLTGEGLVTIDSGDGLSLSGEGFSADMARETYRFTSGVRGTLETDDDN